MRRVVVNDVTVPHPFEMPAVYAFLRDECQRSGFPIEGYFTGGVYDKLPPDLSTGDPLPYFGVELRVLSKAEKKSLTRVKVICPCKRELSFGRFGQHAKGCDKAKAAIEAAEERARQQFRCRHQLDPNYNHRKPFCNDCDEHRARRNKGYKSVVVKGSESEAQDACKAHGVVVLRTHAVMEDKCTLIVEASTSDAVLGQWFGETNAIDNDETIPYPPGTLMFWNDHTGKPVYQPTVGGER